MKNRLGGANIVEHKIVSAWACTCCLLILQCGRINVSEQTSAANLITDPTSSVPFTTLAKGVHSAIREPKRVVIRAKADWQALWSEHVAGLVPSPPLPPVDFRTHMVIAVFRGNTEGGFPIGITDIEKRPTELVIFFEELSPPVGVPLGVAVIRQPYHIVQIERLALSVVFQKRT